MNIYGSVLSINTNYPPVQERLRNNVYLVNGLYTKMQKYLHIIYISNINCSTPSTGTHYVRACIL